MKKTKIVNLTPHSIHELITGTVYPSEGLARCAVLSSDTGDRLNGVPVLELEFGEVSGLPEPTPGVVYIVSQIVWSACPDRKDVVFPGELVRDENGNVFIFLDFSRRTEIPSTMKCNLLVAKVSDGSDPLPAAPTGYRSINEKMMNKENDSPDAVDKEGKEGLDD